MKPQRLTFIAFAAPASLDLQFADGERFVLPVSELGMPGPVDWETLCLYPATGDATVNAGKEEACLDAGHLRYLCDPAWRAEADRELA